MGNFGRFAAADYQKQVSQGVPGVPTLGNPQKSAILGVVESGTLCEIEVSQGVPDAAGGTKSGTPGTPAVPPSAEKVSQVLCNENNALRGGGTLGTPGTPNFDNARENADFGEWDAEDWRVFYDERAGIAEYDGGLSRPDAEARAWECCVADWQNRVAPIIASADKCPVCNRPVGPVEGGAIPVARPGGGHVWLHRGCHAQFLIRRRVEARRALEAMGLQAPKGWTP
jgi:hypothetical protein